MNEIVLIQPTGGQWGQVGVDVAPGSPPERLVCSANEIGSDTASFMIHRDGSAGWNDLLPGSPVDILRDGFLGWSGRISDVSADNGDGTQTVQCKGWQYHLDDDLLRFFGVHRSLTSWKDWRSNLSADLTSWTTAMQVEAGEGGILITHPAGAALANGLAYFDAGPGNVVKRVVIDWAKVQGTTGGAYLRAGRTLAELDSGYIAQTINTATGTTSGTYAYTLSTPCRYVGIQLTEVAGNTADSTLRITKALLFADAAWESSNDSVLTFDKLAKFVLASGALPLLSQATDQIETFGFGFPELDPQQRTTPRELLMLGQALHDCRLQVDVEKKLVCKLRPSAPIFETGSWAQHTFKDASTSMEPIASGVYVEGTGADGSLLESTVDSDAVTLPSRQGFNKRVSLPLESAVTTALMDQLADVYLANHQTAPFKGEMTVQGWGDLRSVTGGHAVHAFHCLTKTEEMMRFGDRIDPDTGAVGRDGRMKSVTYNADTEESAISIDNESRKFEALAGRIAKVSG